MAKKKTAATAAKPPTKSEIFSAMSFATIIRSTVRPEGRTTHPWPPSIVELPGLS